jgi:hypothetical protein
MLSNTRLHIKFQKVKDGEKMNSELIESRPEGRESGRKLK